MSSRWIARWLVGNEGTAGLVSLALISAALSTLNDIPVVVLQAKRKAKTVGLLSLTQLLAVVSISIYLVVVAELGVRGVVLGGLFGNLIAMLASYTTTARFFSPHIDLQIWREMAAYSLPFLPHRLQGALMVFASDYFIRTQLGLTDLGLYNVAARFATPIGFFFGAIQTAWNPYKFKVFSEDSDPSSFFRSTFTYFICLLAYMWMGISIWGPEVNRLMTASAFHEASAFIWAAALVRSAQAVCPIVATGIELKSDTRALPLVSFASLLTVIAANFALTPRFGIYGAAFATTGAWLVIAGGYYVLSQRQLRIDYDWRSITGVCLAAILMSASGQLIQSYSLWVRIVAISALSVAFPIVALVILYGSSTERRRVQILAGRVLGRLRRRNGLVDGASDLA
jgi:O-antigen/teichoic acid export membrane protein